MDIEEKIKEYEEFANIFERSSFLDLKKYIQSLKSQDGQKYKRFREALSDLIIWGEVNRHKLSLAIFIAKKSNVVAFPEDRTRIVLTLAKVHGKDIGEANKIVEHEFGDYFKLLPEYETTKGKRLSLGNITKRATEIRNGLRNVCFLEVENTVREIMIYYRGNITTDKSKLLQIRESTFNLMMKMKDPLVFMNSTFFNEIRPEIENYYKLTNRTQLDIQSLNDPDYDNIAKYVYIMAEIVATKLKLLQKGQNPNDLVMAEKIVLDTLAGINFNEKTSLEEIQRIGMPLPKLNN